MEQPGLYTAFLMSVCGKEGYRVLTMSFYEGLTRLSCPESADHGRSGGPEVGNHVNDLNIDILSLRSLGVIMIGTIPCGLSTKSM